jgi:hypothetical protein
MELENKVKVAVDLQNNVMAFQYQSASLELEVEPYDEAFISEPLFTDQQVNRFKVVDGIVVMRTEQEIKADPTFAVVQSENRAKAYKEESDPLFFKYQRGEVTEQEWLDKVAEIKAKYPKE